jgi:hypothetical protein
MDLPSGHSLPGVFQIGTQVLGFLDLGFQTFPMALEYFLDFMRLL